MQVQIKYVLLYLPVDQSTFCEVNDHSLEYGKVSLMYVLLPNTQDNYCEIYFPHIGDHRFVTGLVGTYYKQRNEKSFVVLLFYRYHTHHSDTVFCPYHRIDCI